MHRAAAASLVFLLFLLLFSAPAAAHPAYAGSDPADGSSVAVPPGRVWAEFTEPLQEGSWLQVFDACGERVDNGDSTVSGYTVEVSVSAQTEGGYRVAYRVQSNLDTHIVTGQFTFDVVNGQSCGGGDPSAEEQSSSTGQPPAAQRPQGEGGQPVASRELESKDDDGVASSKRKPAKDQEDRRERDARSRSEKANDLVLGQRERPEAATLSIWSEIPMKAFAVGLLLAALVGAAGGWVYASIVPRP